MGFYLEQRRLSLVALRCGRFWKRRNGTGLEVGAECRVAPRRGGNGAPRIRFDWPVGGDSGTSLTAAPGGRPFRRWLKTKFFSRCRRPTRLGRLVRRHVNAGPQLVGRHSPNIIGSVTISRNLTQPNLIWPNKT